MAWAWSSDTDVGTGLMKTLYCGVGRGLAQSGTECEQVVGHFPSALAFGIFPLRVHQARAQSVKKVEDRELEGQTKS